MEKEEAFTYFITKHQIGYYFWCVACCRTFENLFFICPPVYLFLSRQLLHPGPCSACARSFASVMMMGKQRSLCVFPFSINFFLIYKCGIYQPFSITIPIEISRYFRQGWWRIRDWSRANFGWPATVSQSNQQPPALCWKMLFCVCDSLLFPRQEREREIAVNGRVTQAAVISFSSSNSRRRADLPKLQRNTGRTGGGGSGKRNKNVALCTQLVDPLRELKLDGHRGRRIYKEGGVTLREGGAGMRVKVGMTSWFSKWQFKYIFFDVLVSHSSLLCLRPLGTP